MNVDFIVVLACLVTAASVAATVRVLRLARMEPPPSAPPYALLFVGLFNILALLASLEPRRAAVSVAQYALAFMCTAVALFLVFRRHAPRQAGIPTEPGSSPTRYAGEVLAGLLRGRGAHYLIAALVLLLVGNLAIAIYPGILPSRLHPLVPVPRSLNVAIHAPPSGAVFRDGQEVALKGGATNRYGLVDLTWHLGGRELGTGPSARAEFPVGTHTVVLTGTCVVNGIAARDSDTVRVTVQENYPPGPMILTPASGDVFTYGSAVALRGTAVDREDGLLSGSSLEWSSSAGAIGKGGSAVAAALPLGNHEIRFTATDRRGLSSTCSVRVRVRENQFPRVWILEPANLQPFVARGLLVLRGGGTDWEDGKLHSSLVWRSDGRKVGNGPEARFRFGGALGLHRILLTGTDSGGNTDSDTVYVDVTLPSTTQAPAAPVSPIEHALALPIRAVIDQPQDGSEYGSDEPVVLEARVRDAADAEVPDVSVEWRSTVVSTLIRYGQRVVVDSLPPGVHTFTLAALVTQGNVACDTVSFTVVGRKSPPSCSIVYPSDGSSFLEHTPVTFRGIAPDRQEVIKDTSLVWYDSDTELGRGYTLKVPSLSTGPRIIVLRAKDRSGLVGSDRITITISPEAAEGPVATTPSVDGGTQGSLPTVGDLGSLPASVTTPTAGNGADDHFRRGVQLYEDGDMDGAVRAFMRAIYANREYAIAYFNLGKAFSARGYNPAAVLAFEDFRRYSTDEPLRAEAQRYIEQLKRGAAAPTR
jgi:hypothetical protein